MRRERHSSIFNSRKTPVFVPLLGFFGAFLLTAGLVTWGGKFRSGPEDSLLNPPREMDLGSSSLVYDGFEAKDHDLYYHDLKGCMDHVREADVVILGNSRVLCGLASDQLAAVTERSGLKFYNLGFGYDEGGEFALELLRRFDLRPGVVVVNADASFWKRKTPMAAKVADSWAWKSRVGYAEFQAAWHLRRNIHRWLPKIISPEQVAIWRNHENGAWSVRSSDVKPTNVAYLERESLATETEVLIASAHHWKEQLDRLGTTLVLTLVPSPESNVTLARKLGEELGVPLILAPSDASFSTFDGDHLDRESSERFTKLFVEQFESLNIESQKQL